MSNQVAKIEETNHSITLLRKVLNIDEKIPETEVNIAQEYCKAKGLDIIKRPVAIIPFWDSKKGVNTYSIIPTAEAVKTIATRANWAGNDDYVYGETRTHKWQDFKGNSKEIEMPEWGQVTVYKIVGGKRCPFVGPRVYFEERNGKKSSWVNQPWAMFNKCILVAALRNACPEECGGMYIEEELENYNPEEDMTKIPPLKNEFTKEELKAKKESDKKTIEQSEALDVVFRSTTSDEYIKTDEPQERPPAQNLVEFIQTFPNYTSSATLTRHVSEYCHKYTLTTKQNKWIHAEMHARNKEISGEDT